MSVDPTELPDIRANFPRKAARVHPESILAYPESFRRETMVSIGKSLAKLLWLFETEFHDFFEVGVEFVQACALGVSAWETRDYTNVELGFRVPFDIGRKGSHRSHLALLL